MRKIRLQINSFKKSFWCFLLSFCILNLVSCNNDDDEIDNPNENQDMSILHGTWEEVKQESYKNGQIVPDHWSKGVKWTFKKDKSLIHFSKSYTDKGTYDFHDNQITMYYDWYGVDESNRCEILTLTADSLVWKEPYTDDEYDYQILYLTRTTSEYDDPFEVNIVDGYTGKVKDIIEKYKDIRPFVGWWKPTSSGVFAFTSDMQCKYGSDPFTIWYTGSWNYDAINKILGTTIDRTWNITVLTNDEWAGTYVNSGKTTSCTRMLYDWDGTGKYNKLKYFEDPNAEELIVGEWKKEDGTVIYFDENLNYHYKYNGYGRVIEGKGTVKNWHLEDTNIYSVSGNILLIGKYNEYKPTRLDGTYTFQDK